VEITSDPTTGYWWSIEKNHSNKLSVKDYFGEYTFGSNGLDGRGQGKQMFEIHCDDSCLEGERFSLHLILKRSWESTFIDEKYIEVVVPDGPSTQLLR